MELYFNSKAQSTFSSDKCLFVTSSFMRSSMKIRNSDIELVKYQFLELNVKNKHNFKGTKNRI